MAVPPIAIPELELLNELGRGATSVVYRARRQGRLYAVKVPHGAEPGAQSEFRAERFRREAVALARIRHPALPEVMEVGEVEGTPYLVMELVSGQLLAQRLERGPLTESQALELGRQIAGALTAIHQAGLVHCDLKPHNIMFEPDSSRVCLVDFGFATEADAVLEETATGWTRAYAAPEQLAGRYRVDGRADLFSLGVVLYESLAGRSPFGNADTQRLLRQHASVALPVLTDIVPGIQQGVSELVLRLLASDPSDRYPSAAVLTDDITRLQRGESLERPVATSPSWRVADPPAGSSATALIGRASDLELLRDVWLETLEGHARLVVLGGPPGVGKTRLVTELLAGLTSPSPAMLFASCDQSDPRPFSAIRQLLEGYLYAHRHVSSATLDEAENHLRALAGDFAPMLRVLSPMLSDVFRDAAPIPGLDEAHKIFVEGLADFLSRLLRDAEPAVVFVDNAHWLDSGSRRVLARAAHHLASSRVVLLFASRSDVEGQETVAALTRGIEPEHLLRVEIRRLDPRHIRELVQAYLGGSELDPDLLRCVESLSDGTPLSVLELVRTMVDNGSLTYFWGNWRLDRDALARLQLPSQTAELLVRRIRTLEPNTQATLAAAAVVGPSFSDDLLAAINEIDVERTHAALSAARRMALVEGPTMGTHRFVHDTVREALLAQLSADRRRAVHQRIAEVLDSARSTSAEAQAADERITLDDMDQCHILAAHYAQGDVHRNPVRVFETCAAAGRLAFRSFDHERALRFFEIAESAAELSRSPPSPEFDYMVAEARLRTGAMDTSLRRFERVLERTSDSILRAQTYSRIAFIHEVGTDSARAWPALEQAFTALGEQPPTASFGSFILGLLAWIRWMLVPRRKPAPAEERARIEAVSALYHQAAKLAFQCTQPVRFLVATLASLGLAERLGPSAALAFSFQRYAFLLVLLGMRSAGFRYLERARAIALFIHDPAMQAYMLQLRAVALSWGGDVPGATRAGAQVLDEYGHWRELSEYCEMAFSQQLLESVRGRSGVACHWARRAMQRITQHEGAPVVPERVVLKANAALVSAGRDAEARRITERLRDAMVPTPGGSALHAFTYGPRVAAYTESGQLGEEFEAIVQEVRDAKLNPKRVHLVVVEYYVQVAHARVHQCLRTSSVRRQALMPALREACRDLRLASRLRLLKGHHLAVRAFLRWLEGDGTGAKRDFARAEALGREQEAPWVLYAVHRGRAHMLREQGHVEAARDEARMAEALARTHQAAYRLRWIREEFDLRRTEHPYADSNPPLAESERSSLSSTWGGQLRSVLQVAREPAADLDPERQAPTIVDELVKALRAERGFLFLCAPSSAISKPRSNPPRPMRLVAARDSRQHDLVDAEPDLSVVQQVVRRGAAYIANPATMTSGSGAPSAGSRSTVAAPLVLEGALVGVVYLDRRTGSGGFGEEDAELLNTLACQVPLAIELMRSLSARGRLEEYERTARKMEAVSRLAGGIAHDFNNMLAAIRASTEAILADGALSSTAIEDARTIRSATDHAEELTRQLLAFSRSQHLKPEVVLLGGMVQRVAPVLRRLLGPKIALKIDIERELYPVKADRSQLERVLTNLVTNARDAMPEGGQLTIALGNAVLTEQQAQQLSGIAAGPYAVLTVTDTGQGIDSAIRDKLFEPFFTTKTDKGGTGLGLATSYGIVTQSGGAIDVESELGHGTTFHVYIPKTFDAVEPEKADASEAAEEAPPEPKELHGSETLLVVEDEPLVNHAMCRVLQRKGYRIMTARGGNEAMKLAHEDGGDIHLLITDVMMPDMNGVELARELRKLKPDVKVLYTSGFSAGALEEGSIWGNEVEFLQKPVHPDVLVRHVRLLLDRQ